MKKTLSVHNKSSKPDNIVQSENMIIEKCIDIQSQLPYFMIDFFIFLKGAVSINTRQAYLNDIMFFCKYLCEESSLTEAKDTKDITPEDFKAMKARDVNRYLGDYCSRYIVDGKENRYIMENHNRSLSRKKSSHE